MGKLFGELKRRKVFRVAAVYAVVAWVLIQVAATVLPALQLPEWTVTFVTVLFILGFPIAIILAWAYEASTEGIKPDAYVQAAQPLQATSAQPINYLILLIVLLVAGFQVADRFLLGEPAVPESSSTSGSNPVSRFPLILEEGLDFTETENSSLDISRDGSRIVYEADNRIWIRDLDEVMPRQVQGIAPEERPTYPVFSPDGQSLLYFADRDLQLRKISAIGGTPITLTESLGDDPQGLSWNDGGIILFGGADGSIYHVSANGGPVDVLIAAESGEELNAASLLPGGEWVLFSRTTARGAGRWDAAEIMVQSLGSGERRSLWQSGSEPRYVHPGYLVYALDDDLFAVSFDPHTLSVSGGQVPVIAGVQRGTDPTNDSGTANYAVSENGTLVYVEDLQIPEGNALVWANGSGQDEALPLPQDTIKLDAVVSPDGSRIAMTIFEPGSASEDIWVWSAISGTLTRLTFDQASNTPRWTPDGSRIAYQVGSAGLYIRNVDGTGVAELLLENVRSSYPMSWTLDGGLVFTEQSDRSRNTNTMLLQSDGQVIPLLASEFAEGRTVLSPDGRWLAYQSNESGSYQIYVRPFPELDTGKWQVSVAGGLAPKWSRDGATLYFISSRFRGQLLAATIDASQSFTHSTPLVLMDLQGYVVPNRAQTYDVGADGRMLLIKGFAQGALAELRRIIVVQNWFEELTRLAPPDPQ